MPRANKGAEPCTAGAPEIWEYSCSLEQGSNRRVVDSFVSSCMEREEVVDGQIHRVAFGVDIDRDGDFEIAGNQTTFEHEPFRAERTVMTDTDIDGNPTGELREETVFDFRMPPDQQFRMNLGLGFSAGFSRIWIQDQGVTRALQQTFGRKSVRSVNLFCNRVNAN